MQFVKISKSALLRFRKFIISRICRYFEKTPLQLGGLDVIINVDESMINHKVKSHRGRAPTNQTWILCIVDTSFTPSRGYSTIIENRTAAHILPIISNVVRQGSIIYTDDFKAYNSLINMNDYEHRIVVHKYHEHELKEMMKETKEFFNIIGLERNKDKSATNSEICTEDATLLEGCKSYKYLRITETTSIKISSKAFKKIINEILKKRLCETKLKKINLLNRVTKLQII